MFYLNQYMDNTSLINAISQIDIDGGETNIAAAFRVTRYNVDIYFHANSLLSVSLILIAKLCDFLRVITLIKLR